MNVKMKQYDESKNNSNSDKGIENDNKCNNNKSENNSNTDNYIEKENKTLNNIKNENKIILIMIIVLKKKVKIQ